MYQFLCVVNDLRRAGAKQFLPRSEAPGDADAVDPGVDRGLDIDLRISDVEAPGKETGAIVTSEEASVLGGAVAELVAENCPVPVIRHGVNDTFGRSGTAAAVLEHYGLTPEVLAEKCRKAVAMKK